MLKKIISHILIVVMVFSCVPPYFTQAAELAFQEAAMTEWLIEPTIESLLNNAITYANTIVPPNESDSSKQTMASEWDAGDGLVISDEVSEKDEYEMLLLEYEQSENSSDEVTEP